MKTLLKIVLVGTLTTISRIVGQFLIPPGTQSVLEPSIFARQGTMPLVFTIYGILAYSVIASLYLLIGDNLQGHRIIRGLKYGVSCSAIWIVYLWEPLPHVQPLDRITYPLVDSAALLVMGLLLGLLLTSEGPKLQGKMQKERALLHEHLFLTSCFMIGRLILYLGFDIYSCFETQGVQTVVWTFATGIITAIVVLWYREHIHAETKFNKALLAGLVLFGLDLLFFNFFMPLVFAADIPDLILRTVVDILAITTGLIILAQGRKSVSWSKKASEL